MPHRGLISALSRIGVSGSLLRWFTSYLSDRRQQVVVDGSTSASSLVRSGVPQGSILGPLLFSIYIDPITSLSLSSTSKILLYADDILLYKPILCEEDEIALQSDINIIINWINDASLKLNASKTKLLLVSRQKLPPTLSLFVNQEQIQQVDSVVYLGVTLTHNLSFYTHINNTCKQAKSQLGLLYRIFGQASTSALNHLYKALVLPTLDYCSAIWDPYFKCQSDLLEHVQKLASKIVSKRWNISSYEHLLSHLKWEPLALRRKKQKVLLCHRILSGHSIISPSVFTPHPSPHLRHCHNHPLFCPFAHTRSYLSSFFISVIPLWNSTHPNIMACFSQPSFKYRLKLNSEPFL